jgi:hypothetical protein
MESPCFWALAHKNRGIREVSAFRRSSCWGVVSLEWVCLSPTDVILRKAFDLNSNVSHRITSVGDRLHRFRETICREQATRERSASRTPLFLCASAQKQGGSSILRWGCVFAHQKRENPFLLWGIFKNPFPQERVLESVSFRLLSCQTTRKRTPRTKQLNRNHI